MAGTVLQFDAAMIEEVMRDWERETGRPAHEMTPKEFSQRFMVKFTATAMPLDTVKQ